MPTAWMLPDEPAPVRLMNTIWADRHGVHDALTTSDDLARWLRATGLVAGSDPIAEGDLTGFRFLRDALRRLAAVITGDSRPVAEHPAPDLTAAVEGVNAAAGANRRAPQLRLVDGVLSRADSRPGPPVAAARTALAVEGIELLTGGEELLRACLAPGCVLYFVRDHPRREWCSVACGNRVRAARHYHRHRRVDRA